MPMSAALMPLVAVGANQNRVLLLGTLTREQPDEIARKHGLHFHRQ
jgi:hypothetical protein